jgi:NAD(P)-dependent dehydrogenase (short-subunit alcohol dehydrogenase family)
MAQKRCPAVLVTGASRGLGRGVALALAKAGYSVGLGYAGNLKAAEEARNLCRKEALDSGQKFEIFQADLGKSEDRIRLADEAFDAFRGLDALVNNAGMAPRLRADILEASEESFRELVEVNLEGPYFLTQRIARRWVEAKEKSFIPTGFKIVFVTSISAETASVQRGEYCVSKAGLSMAVKLWAARLADEGIQVFEVRPGIMATDMTSKVKEKYDALIAEGLVPQKRWGTPEDVGKAVRSFVDGDFAYSTGSVVYCDGGFNISRL